MPKTQTNHYYKKTPPSEINLVVSTKLNKPPVPTNYVNRAGIIERFDKNIHLPLTLISAATGYGKSTIISHWLDQSNHTYGWLSLDKEHNDINVLFQYLFELFRKTWPEEKFGIEMLLHGINLPLNTLVATLVNDVNQLKGRFILVLDDFHLITDEKILDIFEAILHHPPKNLHLVILTQMDPPLGLAKLRAKFQLNEIRMKDLALSIDEALELRSLISNAASDEQVKTLVEKSEGWITGIMAGLLGLAQGIKFEKVLQALHSSNSIISDLLNEAVLNGLPVESQKYLELLSLVDRFSEDLIKTMVAAIDDSDLKNIKVEDLINTTKKRNLFLIPLDNGAEWYRFHHLFQSQIQKRKIKHFNADTVSIVYKTASNWFEAKKLLEEALSYAIQSKDFDFAVQLFSRFRHQLLNSEQLLRLYRLTNQFPEEVRNNDAEILINLAMLQHYNANFSSMRQYILRAKEVLDSQTEEDDHKKQLIGEYHAISTYLSYMIGDFEKAILHGEKCMALLPAETPNFFREQSAGWYAFAQQANGNSLDGMNRLISEYQNLAIKDQYFQMRLLQGKLIFYLFEGDIAQLFQDGTSLANLCPPKKYPGSWVIGIYSRVCHLYFNNQPEKAYEFHDELREYRYACRPFWTMQHFFIECLAGMAEGLWPRVEQCILECEILAEELAIEPLKGLVNAFKVEYHLRQNNIEHAKQYAVLANFEPLPPLFFYYIPQLTQVKFLYRTNNIEEAIELLEKLLGNKTNRNNKNLLMQALALKSVICFSEGNIDSAKKVLNELLLLYKNTKNLRVFLDQGMVMHQLLREITKDELDNNWLYDLLEIFETEVSKKLSTDMKLSHSRDSQNYDLSNREMEILMLVSKGLKNSEIADQLFVSIDTVKKHLYNAYQKLEVQNRTSALQKIKAIGLIPSRT